MKFRPVAAAALGAALALAACSASPETLLSRAEAAYATHDFKAAQLHLAEVLKARPADPAALLLHARTSLALGDGTGARASLNALPASARPSDFALLQGEAALLRQNAEEALAVVARDRSAEAWRIRAQAALLKGNDADAASAFAAGQRAGGPQVRLLADQARWLLHKGDLASARPLIARALAGDPASLDANLVDARLAVAGGDLARALSVYDKIAKAWPGNLAALVGKAGVLGDLGRTRDMKDVLAQADKAGVNSADLVWLQARAAAADGNWKAARDLLQANEAVLADRSEAQILYAQVLVKLGQPEQARARLQRLQRLLTGDPGNAALRRALAEAAMAARDPAGAVEALRPLASRPDAAAADLRLLAEAARQAGDPEAPRLARRAQFPAAQELARLLAQADTAMKARNWGNAIAAYEQIMALTDGRNPLVLNNLAYAQDQLGNAPVALDYAIRALAAAPSNPSVMDTAGWLMVRTGKDKARGLALLQQAAAKAPANATIRQHLAAAQAGG